MEEHFFWPVLTTNFLFTLYLALGGVTFSAVLHLCNGQWRFQVRHLACALSVLFPIAGVLLLVLLANSEATFPWLAAAHDGEHHLPGWHDYSFLVIREVGGFLAIVALCYLFIKAQHQSEIDSSYKAKRRYRNIALLIPFAYFIYGSMVAWDFEMTMVPGWHSASYAAYFFQSNFHMFLAFFTILLFFLNKSGTLTRPFEGYIFNFMAQFMLGMTILWTYLYFTQYLIMWYGRFPAEMGRYDGMMLGSFATMWWTFLACKFIIPFCTFVITPNRHNPVIITIVACFIVFGSWLERYTWIAGSVNVEHHQLPMSSLFDIVATVVVIGVCYVAVKWSLTRYGLIQRSSS